MYLPNSLKSALGALPSVSVIVSFVYVGLSLPKSATPTDIVVLAGVASVCTRVTCT